MKSISIDSISDIIMENASENLILRSATIELLDVCNYKCEHCYIKDTYHHKIKDDDYYWLIDQLVDAGCYWLVLTGGEILMHESFCEFYEYAYDKGLIITLFTNGYLIDNDIINLLKAKPPREVDITMYGGSPDFYDSYVGINGAFKKITVNINRLLDEKICVKLKTVITKKLFEDYHNTVKYSQELNLDLRVDCHILPKCSGESTDKLRISPLKAIEIDEATSPGMIQKAFNKIGNYEITNKLYSCSAGKNSIFIDANLNASICLMARNISCKLRTGNYTLHDAQKKLLQIKQTKRNLEKNNSCYNCKYRATCRYCPGQFYLENTSETEPIKWYCKYAKALYQRALEEGHIDYK